MQLVLRPVDSLQEAQRLAARLDEHAAEFHAQFSDEPFPRGAAARFLAQHFDEAETVLMTARRPEGGEPVGLCLVGPFEDPLVRRRVPMVLVLYVDPAVRHCGVARALVEEVQACLRARGLTTLAARAGHNDDALISMGERWGFVRSWELMLLE